ncbi:DNA-packaging protein [Robiginitalea biformata]|uniref:Bacteriophage packaging protein gp3-like protein n=1 Tax=Robiginitalea biformata (strain ATCC BAA-864 / DSM 15991 / KCTC 12146 / HTCC2501) TaxID=313596 RepID=A4CPV1_ROBBH|nr:DNA-packaging protein [Robiginitalea biformata]EAR14036.1 bacteriophage packaging protein gp3-like protein [Robiginitalea biformata HTCC2501]
MAAPVGNQYYLLRSKDGRDRIFDSPEDMAEQINEYFQWCLLNPLMEAQVIKGRVIEEDERDGEVVKVTKNHEMVEVPKMRPFTLEGLCNYIDIGVSTFKDYEKRKDFSWVTTRARQIIDNQQFEGAASGFLNPSIIARKLGLADHQKVGRDDDAMTAEELRQELAQIKKEIADES